MKTDGQHIRYEAPPQRLNVVRNPQEGRIEWDLVFNGVLLKRFALKRQAVEAQAWVETGLGLSLQSRACTIAGFWKPDRRRNPNRWTWTTGKIVHVSNDGLMVTVDYGGPDSEWLMPSECVPIPAV